MSDDRGGVTSLPTWSVGELAAATGLTVRTLHHYDEIGLAVPSLRNRAGHRRYTEVDVQRLHRIVALRGFGFALNEIAHLLGGTGDGTAGGTADAGADVRDVVQRQLDQVRDRIARAHRLRDRLVVVLGLLDNAAAPSAAVLIRLIEEMTAVEHAYTPEELEKLAEHRRAMAAQLTPEQLAEMQAQRQAALAKLSPEEIEELHRARMGR